MKMPFTLIKSLLVLTIILSATPAMAQTAYTWNSGGTWSTAVWTPTGTPSTATDTATITLSNAVGTQILTYDSGASGTLGTLTIAETGAGANEVALSKGLTLSNALTLGSSTGQSEVFVNSGGSLTDAAGIAVNSGGVLDINNGSAVVKAAGGLTVATGGTLTAGSGNLIITGLDLEGATGVLNFGTYNSSTSGFQLSGNNIINSTSSGVSIKNLVLINGATLSTNLQASGLFVSGTSSGKINNLSSTYSGAGAQIAGALSFNQFNLSSNTFQLGSNLTISGLLATNTTNHPSSGTGNMTFGIDLNSHTFDFTTGGTTTQAFAPVNGDNPQGSTMWTIGDSSTNGNGTIKADHFTLSGVTIQHGVQGVVNVTNNITLQAAGGNGTANDLGNSLAGGGAAGGTIASTTTFLYSGLASTSSAATLTSNRTIGNLTVQNGALQLTGGTVTTGTSDAVNINNGGTLELNSTSVSILGGAPTLNVGNGTGSGTFDLESESDTVSVMTLGGTGTIKSTGGAATLTATSLSVNGLGNTISSGVTVAAATTVNGALTSSGTFTAAMTLNSGGLIAAGAGGTDTTGKLTATGLTWNSGSTLTFNLDGATTNSTNLNLGSGVLAEGSTGSPFTITLTGSGTMNTAGTYDLIDFGSTGFSSATAFTLLDSSLTFGSGLSGTLSLTGDQLDFIVATSVPEPGTWAMMLGGLAALVFIQVRRRKNNLN